MFLFQGGGAAGGGGGVPYPGPNQCRTNNEIWVASFLAKKALKDFYEPIYADFLSKLKTDLLDYVKKNDLAGFKRKMEYYNSNKFIDILPTNKDFIDQITKLVTLKKQDREARASYYLHYDLLPGMQVWDEIYLMLLNEPYVLNNVNFFQHVHKKVIAIYKAEEADSNKCYSNSWNGIIVPSIHFHFKNLTEKYGDLVSPHLCKIICQISNEENVYNQLLELSSVDIIAELKKYNTYVTWRLMYKAADYGKYDTFEALRKLAITQKPPDYIKIIYDCPSIVIETHSYPKYEYQSHHLDKRVGPFDCHPVLLKADYNHYMAIGGFNSPNLYNEICLRISRNYATFKRLNGIYDKGIKQEQKYDLRLRRNGCLGDIIGTTIVIGFFASIFLGLGYFIYNKISEESKLYSPKNERTAPPKQEFPRRNNDKQKAPNNYEKSNKKAKKHSFNFQNQDDKTYRIMKAQNLGFSYLKKQPAPFKEIRFRQKIIGYS